MFNSTAEDRAAFIRRRHEATSHARGPGCHCSPELGRPDMATGCHAPGCPICDAWRQSWRGKAEAAYWGLSK